MSIKPNLAPENLIPSEQLPGTQGLVEIWRFFIRRVSGEGVKAAAAGAITHLGRWSI